jgi:hypothetical protein
VLAWPAARSLCPPIPRKTGAGPSSSAQVRSQRPIRGQTPATFDPEPYKREEHGPVWLLLSRCSGLPYPPPPPSPPPPRSPPPPTTLPHGWRPIRERSSPAFPESPSLVFPQRLQVHTVRCRSSSQPLCHWCRRIRQINRAFTADTFRSRMTLLRRHPGCKWNQSNTPVARQDRDWRRSSARIHRAPGGPGLRDLIKVR